MLKDQHGNPISTESQAARDAYVDGVDRFLAGDPGVEEAFRTAIEADERFALAHIGLSRQMQMLARGAELAVPLARARELSADTTAREQSHIAALGLLLEGKAGEAYPLIRAHASEHPRDAMVAQTCTSVFGLIGFSGRKGREAEQLAYTTSLAPHWGDDWWFQALHAFALLEVGRTAEAEPLLESALTQRPGSAIVAHIRAHLYYENGETTAGYKFIRDFREGYAKTGLLHCHVSWHAALWALEQGEEDVMWDVVDKDIAPGTAYGPPLNILTDIAAILYRAELAGLDVAPERWWQVSAYAAEKFPNPGLAFADFHAALAHAMAGDDERLSKIIENPKGPAADIVARVSQGMAALARQQWAEATTHLTNSIADHERLGGSRAQRDLIEFGLAAALLRQGKGEEARRLLAMHRPISTPPGAVAGL